MTRSAILVGALLLSGFHVAQAQPKRVFILKVDGMGHDLLQQAMQQTDPQTGKSELPWISYLFGEHGVIFDNFYSRGISLSAPSWSILDTGRHAVIRGNVEFDRFTGRPYDYLNFIPFYLSYARNREVDMPGVEVLDRAGIPLLVDRFDFLERYVSFQLFQRGVRWQTLTEVLKRRLSSDAIIATVENAGAPSYESLVEKTTESEIDTDLRGTQVLYLDFYNGDVDHLGHATSQPEALLASLKRLDGLVGRVWTEIQKSPMAKDTLIAMVSDHGMNNVPGIISQTYSITDFLASPAGGGHHIVTDRPQLSDFKIRGLDPLVSRVVTPSATSFYLQGEAKSYPTAWLDIDGNERTSVHLRNNELNRIHILLKQLARKDLPPQSRSLAAAYIGKIIDRNRTSWTQTADQLTEEMAALSVAIEQRRQQVKGLPTLPSSDDNVERVNRANRRLVHELDNWENEHARYTAYVGHLRKLIDFRADVNDPLKANISDLVPEMVLGPNNSVADIQNYVVGLSAGGIAADSQGQLDEKQTFRHINYPPALVCQRVRNLPQPQLSPRPIDFIAMTVPPGNAYWLYGDDDNQLIIRTDNKGGITVQPVAHLIQEETGAVHWQNLEWRAGLPLALFEDSNLHLPVGADRAAWLSQTHSEREWMEAIHQCRYSTGVIGIIEELSPVADETPGPPGANPLLVRFAKRQRELVQTDFHIFAADHWNFNVRFPNPGGNHGAFFRISTHAVWMMAGEGIPATHITEPYDGLNFANTVLHLLGREAPLPDRVVAIPSIR